MLGLKIDHVSYKGLNVHKLQHMQYHSDLKQSKFIVSVTKSQGTRFAVPPETVASISWLVGFLTIVVY